MTFHSIANDIEVQEIAVGPRNPLHASTYATDMKVI
eukprot:CAMPEP_0194441020 /NCGR_PEP_ID=MMETSP0176-20130528/119265_1 /TAXON_ID=216777 /ORGANISM="Proboscia alata, Strain PI-D3" /LENGTH=35 /DNA_ID= /DNA_START= /DNA_END= /DNA_ORIENTATION=